MSTEPMPECPQCGALLPPNAPAGLCPRCLMAVNMATQTVLSDEEAAVQSAPKPPPPAPEEIAPHFPQLEILECLGRGGMGVVYKARQKSLNRFVALKLLAPERANDPQFAARFEKEARALAALNHPNIVTIHDHGQAGGFYYLIMEFVDGVTLRKLLAKERVSAREALAIVPQICDALQFAHDQGIVHRDIKPENILLDRRGRVKVADFGLAKIVESGRPGHSNLAGAGDVDNRGDLCASEVAVPVTGALRELTDAGKVMGTPQYMSPEQRDNPGEVDHRADIYALGVVFYQMLTGELPDKKIEPPSKKVQIDVRLDEVVLRALEQQPELRYQQASVLKTEVETIVATPPQPADSAPQLPIRAGESLYATAEFLGTTWGAMKLHEGLGTLALYSDRLVLNRGWQRTEIPFRFVRRFSVASYPFWLSPAGLRSILVEFEEAGQIRRLMLTPSKGMFSFVSDTKRRVAEWFLAIREAITAANGRPLAGSDTPELYRGFSRDGIRWAKLALASIPLVLFASVLLVTLTSPRQPLILLLLVLGMGMPLLIARSQRKQWQRENPLPPTQSDRPKAEGEEPGERPNASTAANSPRFSRAAIVGTAWVPFFFISVLWYFQKGHVVTPESTMPETAWGLVTVVVTIGLLGFAAPFVTTILGWVAVLQVRRSAGRLHGLWLAVFDGLLFPLLTLNAIVMLTVVAPFKLGLFKFSGRAGLILLCGTATVGLVMSNIFIIHRVWRAVKKTVAASAPPNQKPDRFWRKRVLALVLVPLGLLLVSVPLLWTAYRSAEIHTPQSDQQEIESVVVSTDKAVVKQRSFHDEGMIIMLGPLTNRWEPRHLDSLFAVTLESHWFGHGVNWVVKSTHGPMGYNLDGPAGPMTGHIVFQPGTPPPEADGSYVIGKFQPDGGEPLPISVRLEKTSNQPASSVPNKSFGPVLERVVNRSSFGASDCQIDLDSGRLFTLPPDGVDWNWIVTNGIDAFGEPADANVPRLLATSGTVVVPVAIGAWEAFGIDDVHRLAVPLSATTPGGIVMQGANEWPAAFVFKTRDGGMGLLQITGFAGNPRGVRIRYKLVQTGSNQPSSTPAISDLRKTQPIQKSEEADSPPATPRNAIRLTVWSQFGQKPIPEFRVLAGVRPGSVGGSDTTVNWQPHTLRSGKEGSLDWPLDKAYDPMMLRVEADGWIPAMTAWIKRSEGAKDISITLAEDPGIRGRVLTPKGKPATGATLALAMIQREAVIENGKLRGLSEPLPEKAADRWSRPVFVQTDADGRFIVPQLKDPSAALLIVHESSVREMPLSDIERASEITLQEWGRIEGRVLWQDRPGTNEEISLAIFRDAYGYPGVIAQYEHAKSDASGRYVFEKLLPGDAQLSRPFTREGGQIVLPGLSMHIDVKAGGSTPALVGGRGRIVKGRLTGRDSWQGTSLSFHPQAPHAGLPGDDAMWAAFGEFRGSAIGPIFFRGGLKPEADGSFVFPKVLPGTYQLFVDDDGGNRRSAGKFTVDLEKGEDSEQPHELGEIAL